MDRLMGYSSAAIPATWDQALIYLGLLLLIAAAIVWARRSTFAPRARDDLNRVGAKKAAARMNDEFGYKLSVRFALLWAALGIVLIGIGSVLLLVSLGR
jgi:hypothetical protein